MTAYYARVLEDDVPLALDVIADIVLNPVFEPDEIEVERGVILQEIGQALDTPDDIIFDWLQEAAYPDQPLGPHDPRPGRAGRALLARRSRGLRGASITAPDQMILSAAGAVDHDAMVRAGRDALRRICRRAARCRPSRARFAGGERARGARRWSRRISRWRSRAPGYRDRDFYTAQVYATALGGGMSSRLFQEIREKRGPLLHDLRPGRRLCRYRHDDDLCRHLGRRDRPSWRELTIDEMKRAAERHDATPRSPAPARR